MAALLSVLSTAAAVRFVSLESLGVDPQLTFIMQLSILALQIPMVMFASSIQMLVSLFAKSFKEAQAYLGMLTLLPMLPVMISMFRDIKTATWMYWVPIGGQQQLMTSLMRGEGMDRAGFFLSATVTMALALALFALLTRLVRSERVVYGG
jgi:sodium transport system permease protein